MEFIWSYVEKLKGLFGITNALEKEYKIQNAIVMAYFINFVLFFVTYLVQQIVLDDLTLRIYFESTDTKERCGLAAVLWCCIWYGLVYSQNRYNYIKPTMGMYTLGIFSFTHVLVFGAYSAAELHMYP